MRLNDDLRGGGGVGGCQRGKEARTKLRTLTGRHRLHTLRKMSKVGLVIFLSKFDENKCALNCGGACLLWMGVCVVDTLECALFSDAAIKIPALVRLN